MPLLDGMLRAGRLAEFVSKLVDMHNEEQKDKTLWELWLYRVHDKSYNEFLEAIGEREPETTTEQERVEIVNESMSILDGFKISTTPE